MTVSPTDYIASEIHLSPSEKKVLGFLSPGVETDTRTLARRFYRNSEFPDNGQIVVSGIVRRLERKTSKLRYRIKRGERDGPHPMTVKLEKAT